MKKTIALILALTIIPLGLTGCKKNADESRPQNQQPANRFENPYMGFKFYENYDDCITIMKYVGSEKDIVIPDKIDGKAVTEIDSQAFYRNTTMQTLKMPDTITKINYQAFFECPSLTSVECSKNLKIIGEEAFKRCPKLSEITIPNSVVEIKDSAFTHCIALKKISIPKSVTTLSASVFEGSALEEITLSEGLKVIGNRAFLNSGLKKINIPSTVETIGATAFAHCNSLSSITLNEGLINIEDYAFSGKLKQKSITIPKSVKNLSKHAFKGWTSLESVKFEGDAPKLVDNKIKHPGFDKAKESKYTVHYHSEANGFTTPKWNGHSVKTW